MPGEYRWDDHRQYFIECVIALDWEDKTLKEKAEMFDVSIPTISNWEAKLDWAWVRAERSKKYAKRLAKIDSALLKMAEKGSLGHIELAYKRFDGYIPSSAINVANQTDDDLKRIALELAAADAAKGQGSSIPGISSTPS